MEMIEQDYKKALEALTREFEQVSREKDKLIEDANLTIVKLQNEISVQRETISHLNEQLEIKDEALASKDSEHLVELDNKERVIKTQMDTIEDLVEQSHIASLKIEELENELNKRVKTEDELNEKIGDLLVEINNLEKDKENLSIAPQLNQSAHKTIQEEEDDELVPKTPPARQYPRESIGQWSVNRMRNNMSVKSLISSMEKGKRPL